MVIYSSVILSLHLHTLPAFIAHMCQPTLSMGVWTVDGQNRRFDMRDRFKQTYFLNAETLSTTSKYVETYKELYAQHSGSHSCYTYI